MATNPSLVGRLLAGRYRLQQRRGAGAHGIVLDAIDEKMERPVAVKLLRPQFAIDTAAEARFRFEAQAAASLTHPNLNAVYDWGVEEMEGAKVPYLVLEHLSGGSLRDMIDRGRLLSPSQALIVGLDVCRGLDYMHRRGMMHRDLTPANLAFGEDRHVRILDVGLSRYVAEQTWAEPTAAGIDAARYASPEQARGGTPSLGTLTDATDIYSLCLVLIESVTGQVPFSSDSTMATLSARIDKLMPVSADFGPLASVLSRAGSADPAQRYTAAEFGRALVQAAEKLPRPAPLLIVGSGLFGEAGSSGESAIAKAPPTTALPVVSQVPPVPPPAPRTVPVVPVPDTTLLPLLLAQPPPISKPTPIIDPHTGQPPGPPPIAFESPTAAANLAAEAPPPQIDFADDDLYDPPRRRRFGWIIAAVVVLAALTAGGLLVYRELQDKSYAVPDLAGVSEAVARNTIAERDWTVVVTNEHSDQQPAGNIIRTDPAPGVKLTNGSSITFVVSEGPTLATLPDITGQTLDAATALLATDKLAIAVDEQVFDETAPDGTIMSWTVPSQPGLIAGAQVMQSTVVSVVVSKGPIPREVPNLIGMDEATATAALANIQLTIARAADNFSSDYPVGIVVDQSVPAGTKIARGETVTFAISKGPDLVAIPALGGLTYDQIVQALTDAGLTVGTVTGGRVGGTITDASVGGVVAVPGQQYLRGTAIDLVFT